MCIHFCVCIGAYSFFFPVAAVTEDRPADLGGYQKLKNKAQKRFDDRLVAADKEEEEEEEDGDEGVEAKQIGAGKLAVPWKGKHVSLAGCCTL